MLICKLNFKQENHPKEICVDFEQMLDIMEDNEIKSVDEWIEHYRAKQSQARDKVRASYDEITYYTNAHTQCKKDISRGVLKIKSEKNEESLLKIKEEIKKVRERLALCCTRISSLKRKRLMQLDKMDRYGERLEHWKMVNHTWSKFADIPTDRCREIKSAIEAMMIHMDSSIVKYPEHRIHQQLQQQVQKRFEEHLTKMEMKKVTKCKCQDELKQIGSDITKIAGLVYKHKWGSCLVWFAIGQMFDNIDKIIAKVSKK